MRSNEIADFYKRDIHKLIEEINLFRTEEDLWRVQGDINNSGGNLALHIVGGLNFLIGATLARTRYICNRDQEFTQKGVAKQKLLEEIQALIPMISKTVGDLSPEALNTDYPIFFDKPKASVGYVLLQLLLHLNYHIGQINYLRRTLQ